MPVIAYVNQKGGCSKSTTTVHHAAWLHRQGKDVLVVDADAQRSSSLWLDELEESIPYKVIGDADALLDQLPKLESDFVLVDGPAGLSEVTRAILLRTHLAVIPTQPTGVDLKSAGDAIKLVRQAQSIRNGMPQAAMFLSRAVKGTRLLQEAREVLEKTGVPLLASTIYQRQAIADSFGQGAAVWQMPGKPASEAGTEYEMLFSQIMEMLP